MEETISDLKSKVLVEVKNCDEDGIREKEASILELADLLAVNKRANDLADLIKVMRPFLQQVSKAKAAKLVRMLVDRFLDMEAGTGQEVDLCRDCIAWANHEKRTFLRQALEARLMALYYEVGRHEASLALGTTLLRELKKLDDKALLVEVQLMESKTYSQLGNLQRARAALTSARTTANGIYCPPKLQAGLDMQSGVLHAADERDFKTAFSYFYESFEGYDSIDNGRAVTALKYMLLSKIMLHLSDEVPAIISGKLALKYAGSGVEAMREIAQAASKRSLADFLAIQKKFNEELRRDPVINKHLDSLYDSLLEQNLCKLIEPYSRVQVEHIASLINLSLTVVELKLSQMILDKKLNGILDQGNGVLVMYDDKTSDKTYEASLETIQSLGKVIDQLYVKAKKLT